VQGRCDHCHHEWQYHVGASYDATALGACDDCLYERDHEGRVELCTRHAPDAVCADVRCGFVVDVLPGTPEWASVLVWARALAGAIHLDIPEDDGWPSDAREAAATLRRRAGLRAPEAADYTSVPPLAVDHEVWAAFGMLAHRAYDATVLRSVKGWDRVLDFNDEGTSVVATLTPDEWKTLVDELGAGRVRTLPPRRRWFRRRRDEGAADARRRPSP
jgi:hypothetical protein